MLDYRMPMPFVFHYFQVCIRVALMGGNELVMSNDLVFGDFLPFGSADVVLRVDKRVADETDVGHDRNEISSGHAVPFVTIHFGVIDLEARSDGVGQAM